MSTFQRITAAPTGTHVDVRVPIRYRRGAELELVVGPNGERTVVPKHERERVTIKPTRRIRARSPGRSRSGRSSARPTCCRTGARSRPCRWWPAARSRPPAWRSAPNPGSRRRSAVLLAFGRRWAVRWCWHGGVGDHADRAEAGSRGGGGRMIITVTLNTAIDKTLSVPNFRLGRRHRTVEQTTMPGGKGVNVARVLKTLGHAGDRHRPRRRRDRHPHRRAADAAVGAQRLRAHPRGVAHQHRGDRPDDRRADRDQRARPEGLRAGGRAVRRQAAVPRQGRAHVRVRRLAPARRRHRRLRAADPRAAPARASSRSSTPTATRCGARCARSRTSSRRTCSRPRSSSATSSTTTRTASIAVREMVGLGAREAIMTMPDGCFAHMHPPSRTAATARPVPRAACRPAPSSRARRSAPATRSWPASWPPRYNGGSTDGVPAPTASPAAPSRPSIWAPGSWIRTASRACSTRSRSQRPELPAEVT